MLRGEAQPSFWVCALLQAQRFAVRTVYSVSQAQIPTLNFFSPSKMVQSSHKSCPGSFPSVGGEHNCQDFFCSQAVDHLPVSTLSHLRFLSASGHASGLLKEFRLTPFLNVLFKGRWGETIFQCNTN